MEERFAVSLEEIIYKTSKRPRCKKCGRPDILWFVGQACEHEKEKDDGARNGQR